MLWRFFVYLFLALQQMQKQVDKKLSKLYIKALNNYQLLQDGDKVLMGLSGGKDSLALLHFLGQSVAFPKMKIEVVAVHIAMQNIDYGVDLEKLKALCEHYNIPFIYKIAEFTPSDKKDVCFLCSWTRRKVFFELAQELECNKIALGHHKDDILETLLMNMMFQGSISSIPPLLKMDKIEQRIIRPLCLMEEDDISALAKAKQWPKTTKLCPYEKQSKRVEVRDILEQMKAISPDAKSSLWRSMSNVQEDYLPKG